MAQLPPPTQTGWFPAPPQGGLRPEVLVAIIVVLVVVGFGFVAILTAASGGMFFVGILPLFFCLPFLLIIVFIVIAIASSSSQRRIPPPPPIQQPMVPAGQQGPVALDCPNCGGPPSNVDRFGVATCSYCGTRFLVR